MILGGGGKLKLGGGNPPFPRVLYETLIQLRPLGCVTIPRVRMSIAGGSTPDSIDAERGKWSHMKI